MVASRCVRLARRSTNSRSRRLTIPASSDRLSRNAQMTCASANAVLLLKGLTAWMINDERLQLGRPGGGRSYIRPEIRAHRLADLRRCIGSSQVLSLWQPQIIKPFGLTNMQTGLLNSVRPFWVVSTEWLSAAAAAGTAQINATGNIRGFVGHHAAGRDQGCDRKLPVRAAAARGPVRDWLRAR